MKTKPKLLTNAIPFVLSLALSSMATTYHVAKSGNDVNSGSQSSPYLTISKAAQILQPGDSVIVHTGEYREWVQPARGGSSETARITYKAAPGETVVVKGSERITTWVQQDNSIWKVDLPDTYFAQFGDWRPFRDTIVGRYTGSNQGGEWLNGGSWCHLGDVYVDGAIYLEKQTQTQMQTSPNTWFTSRSGTTQTIYANFGTVNPNVRLTEINVRQAVFGKDVQTGINYITVDGFTMSQSAEEWLPTYASPNSRGTIFTSGGNWIIQNCTVTLAKMRGIVTEGGANFIVRNNIVENCGSAGIGGANADGSIVSGNWVRNIHGTRSYVGEEHAGIKYHYAKNMIFSGNIINNVISAPNSGHGIWLDWPKGNNRITGNVIANVSRHLIVLENPSGPHLMDNNVLAGGRTSGGRLGLEDGDILINNLILTEYISIAPGYWGQTQGVYNKFFNNIMGYFSMAWIPPATGNSSDYNAFFDCPYMTLNQDTHGLIYKNTSINFSMVFDTITKSVTMSFTLNDPTVNLVAPIVTTSSIGQLTVGSSTAQMNNPDGTPLTIDKDFFQNCRTSPTKIGPFNQIKSGVNSFTVRPSSAFDYKQPCVPGTAIRTSAVQHNHLSTKVSTALFDIQGRSIKSTMSNLNATRGLPMGAYIASGTGSHVYRVVLVK